MRVGKEWTFEACQKEVNVNFESSLMKTSAPIKNTKFRRNHDSIAENCVFVYQIVYRLESTVEKSIEECMQCWYS